MNDRILTDESEVGFKLSCAKFIYIAQIETRQNFLRFVDSFQVQNFNTCK